MIKLQEVSTDEMLINLMESVDRLKFDYIKVANVNIAHEQEINELRERIINLENKLSKASINDSAGQSNSRISNDEYNTWLEKQHIEFMKEEERLNKLYKR